jgi:proteasome lid subunit RPN8/RPN11
LTLSTTVRRQVEVHAAQEYPRECCGLVIVESGRQRYVPCRNVADTDGYFSISPREYVAAEDRGEIVAVVHSHPDASPEPSDADLGACRASGLPWWILSWPGVEWRNVPTDDAGQVLAGRAFKYGASDCAAIVAEWFRREAGIELPPFPRDKITSFSCSAFREYVERSGFASAPVDEPRRKGDVVLMQFRGDQPDHLGVIDGTGRLVHHLAGRLSSRDEFVGNWADSVRAVFRHDRLAANS